MIFLIYLFENVNHQKMNSHKILGKNLQEQAISSNDFTSLRYEILVCCYVLHKMSHWVINSPMTVSLLAASRMLSHEDQLPQEQYQF